MSKQPTVIAVANNKGGVGKTSSAAALGGELARRGHTVLCLDLDPQRGNLTAVLHGRGYAGNTLLSVLLKEADLYATIVPTKEKRLYLLPASMQLLQQEKRLQLVPGYHGLLRKLLPRLVPYKYVVIDCPPSLGDLTMMALAAADVYLIPCEPEPLAFDGLQGILDAAAVVRENLNEGLRWGGLFLTAYHPAQRNGVRQTVAALIREAFGEAALLPAIRHDKSVPESQAHGYSVPGYAPDRPAARDYAALTDALLAKL